MKDEQIAKYQERKLKEIIKHSYNNVWYYKQLFKKAKITPDDIKTISDLRKIPVSEKEDFRELPIEKICAQNYDIKDSLVYPSSGSSGIPLLNPYEKKAMLKQYIHFFLTQKDRGVKITDKQVVIGADWVATTAVQNILNVFPFKSLDPAQRSELLLKEIRKYKPKIMVAYPSAAMIIAKEIRENELNDITIQKIFLSGENLSPYSKKYIEDSYGAEVFNDYGANEVGGIAIECSKRKKHIWGDSVIVEIQKDGELVPIDEEGNITVTTLTNYMNPFIRYNCKDVGKLVEEKCSCDNNYPLMEVIQGRSSDFIYLPDGKVVSALGVNPILEAIPGNKQFQVIQEKIDYIKIKMIKGINFESEKTINQIKTKLGEKLGKIFIEVEIVEDIPKQHTGKLKAFISHLKDV
ncbi:MAG: phenylacetate--CoA ligase family protein [Candidatus Hodarchaeales archaeon]